MKKQKNRINKEEIAEDYCFVCKDGGLLRVCDYRGCLKGYHPLCVGKDDSFADAENRWTCSWHSCLICNKTSKFYCFLCTNAVCGTCIGASELVLVRGNKGFCNHCLKLARLIEEDADVDSEGGTVDFKDRDTYEFLFKEYYEEIKDKEGLTAEDVRTGLSLMKKNRNFSNGADLEVTEESEDYHLVISDYDGMDDVEKHKNKHKRKREKRQDCLKKTKVKSKNQEFIGWGSKALIEFLDSTGQDTSKMLSQRDATSIITQYINKNKLTHPDKKKMVICDARLQSVLRRRLVNRNRIYNLLSAHFTENFISSEEEEEEDEEEAGYSSEKVGRSTLMVCKKNIKSNMEMKYTEKKVELNIQKSCFASITPKNIKLVYLKRTLVEELLREFESFERKLVGSFIKVKSNPNDYLQKNSHQLLQVTGFP